MVTARFLPTAEDMIAVQRAVFLRSLKRPEFRRRMTMLCGAAFLICFLLGLALGDVPASAAGTALIGTAFGVGLLAIMIGGHWLLLPRRARRWFAQQKTLHHEQEISWSTEGLRQRSTRADSFYPWAEFHGWQITRDMVLVYATELMVYFVPTRALDDGKVAEMRAILLTAGLPPH